MRRTYGLLLAMALAVPLPAAAQMGPAVELHGSNWHGSGGNAGGGGLWVGGSGPAASAGVGLDLLSASGARDRAIAVTGSLGPRLSVVSAVRLGLDLRMGVLGTLAGNASTPPCQIDCVLVSEDRSNVSVLGAADVSAELGAPAGKGAVFVVRYGLGRLFGGEAGGAITTLSLGIRYRFR